MGTTVITAKHSNPIFHRQSGNGNSTVITDSKRIHGSTTTNNNNNNREEPDNSYCTTSSDCSYNGECIKLDPTSEDPELPGRCDCFQGWKGSTCEVFDALPINPKQLGLQLPNHDSSTWGGSVEYDKDDKLYHMFASEILFGCGLYYWTTNSQIIRAVSKSPYGPYKKVQTIVPVFAHDTNVVRVPTTGEWVLFYTGRQGVTPIDCRKHNATIPINDDDDDDDVPPKDTFMIWSTKPEGPWSKPVMVLNSTKWNTDYWAKYNHTAKCDSNLNGIILNDNSFIGLWRRCETPELLTIPHLLTAKNWKDASSYQPHVDSSLFVLAGSGAEDPSNIWPTRTSDMKPGQVAFHAIFHDEQATRCMLGWCGGVGRHAVSLSDINGTLSHGSAWRYSTVNAYDRFIYFSNGTTIRADTRARPHVVLDPHTKQPIAISTGLKETDQSGYVWTLVTPLRKKKPTIKSNTIISTEVLWITI
jgi:hypothetical protein